MELYSRKPVSKMTGSSIKLSPILPHYTHIIKPRLRYTYLSFDEEGNLIIKSPEISPCSLEKLLLKKSDWIRRSREKIIRKKGKIPDFMEGGELYYKGCTYPFQISLHNKQNTQLKFDEGKFFLYTNCYDETHLRKQIDRFYKRAAERELPAIIEKYAKQMQLFPEAIRFRKTKRQWGSCSSKNILSFNTMLMKLPLNVVEYVVIHELAHILHKHHQKSFWELVKIHMPDYKTHIAELHTYTT